MYESFLETFEFVEDTEVKDCVVRLLTDPYKGVVVTLGPSFKFLAMNEQQVGLEFEHSVVGVPEGFDEQLVNGEFRQHLGNLLFAILELRCSHTDVMIPDDKTGYFTLGVK